MDGMYQDGQREPLQRGLASELVTSNLLGRYGFLVGMSKSYHFMNHQSFCWLGLSFDKF